MGESTSINELTLPNKVGHNLNLSCLLKGNLLDEDGIEDMHFYFVSFNKHKNDLLKLHERTDNKEGLKGPKKVISGQVNVISQI